MLETVIKGFKTPWVAFNGVRDYLNTPVPSDRVFDEIQPIGAFRWLWASLTGISGWGWLWAPFQLVLNVLGGVVAVVVAMIESTIPVIRQCFDSPYESLATLKEPQPRQLPRAVLIVPLFLLALLSELCGVVVGIIAANAFALGRRFSEYKAWTRIAYRQPGAGSADDLAPPMADAPKPTTYPWYAYLGEGVGIVLGVGAALAINAGTIVYEIALDTMAFLYSRLYPGEFPDQVNAWGRIEVSDGMKWLMSLAVVLGGVVGVALSILVSVWRGYEVGFMLVADHLSSVKASTIGGRNEIRRYMENMWLGVKGCRGWVPEYVQLPIVFLFKLPFFFLPALVGALVVSALYMALVTVRDVIWQLLVALKVGLGADLFGIKLSPDFYSMRQPWRYKDTYNVAFDLKARSPWRTFLRLPSLAVGLVGGFAIIASLYAVRYTVRAIISTVVFLAGLVKAGFGLPGDAWDCLFPSQYDQVKEVPSDWVDHAKAHHIDCTGEYVNSTDAMWVKPTNPLFALFQAFWRRTRWGMPSAAEQAVEIIDQFSSDPAKGVDVNVGAVCDELWPKDRMFHGEWWTQSKYQNARDKKAVDWLVEAHQAMDTKGELDEAAPTRRYTLFDHMREEAFDRSVVVQKPESS